MTRLQELREQAAAAIEAAKLKAADAKEELQLKMVIARTNDNAVLARVRAEVKREASDKLTLLNAACDSIVAEMPIFSARTKENRKWNPSRQYGYGNQIAMITGLLSGIQYSALDHKQQMLALTNLDDDLIEETIAAFGAASYYSANYHVVTDEVPSNIPAILAGLDLVEERLGLTLDKSAITNDNMRSHFNKARLTAEKKMAEVEAALATPTINIQ